MKFSLFLCSLTLMLHSAAWAAKVGEDAPAFSVTDSKGKTHDLKEVHGKWVVLEWLNAGCPFIKKHYKSGHMQKLQNEWTKKGVIWFSVISSAPGKEGHKDGKAADAYTQEHHASPTATLLDPKGEMGRAYGAKTTPHMFVINPEGKLVYNGAIDNRPTAAPADEKTDITAGEGPYIDYLSLALQEAMEQKKATLSHPSTPPYGCSVKY